jgi:SET family sugar efflux transporter-like MFS transporter
MLLWLQPLNGLAMAALLTVTISYVQDSIKGRIGLSTSLIDILGILATLLAGIFGLLAAGQDYPFILVLSAAIAVLGGLAVLLATWRIPAA